MFLGEREVEKRGASRSHGGLSSRAPCQLWPALLALLSPLLLGNSWGDEGAATAWIDQEERAAACLINAYRQAQGLGALVLSPSLAAAARAYSREMATMDFFSHVGLDGSGVRSRARAFGYTYNTWLGEALAAGRQRGDEAFQQWRESLPHKDLLLKPFWRAMGIGRAFGQGSRYGWYWTALFGGVKDQVAREPLVAASSECGEPLGADGTVARTDES